MQDSEKNIMEIGHVFLHQLAGYLKNTKYVNAHSCRSQLNMAFLEFNFHEDFRMIIEKQVGSIKIAFNLPDQCGLEEMFIKCLKKNKNINKNPIPQKIRIENVSEKNIFVLIIDNRMFENDNSVFVIGEFIILIIKNIQKWITYTNKHLTSIEKIIQTAGKNFRFTYS